MYLRGPILGEGGAGRREEERGEGEKEMDGPLFKFVNTPLARDCSLH